MPYLALFAVAYGLCFGLMNGKAKWLTDVLVRFDFFRRMLVCAYCTGFHSGWLAWLLVRFPTYASKTWNHGNVLSAGTEVLATAYASAAICYLLDTAAQWAETTARAAETRKP